MPQTVIPKTQPWKANWPPAAEQSKEIKKGFGFSKGEQIVLDGAQQGVNPDLANMEETALESKEGDSSNSSV
jgi:hypothetical protein